MGKMRSEHYRKLERNVDESAVVGGELMSIENPEKKEGSIE